MCMPRHKRLPRRLAGWLIRRSHASRWQQTDGLFDTGHWRRTVPIPTPTVKVCCCSPSFIIHFLRERKKKKSCRGKKSEIAVNYSLPKLRDDASQVWRHCINGSSNQGNAGWQLANVGSDSLLKHCHFTLFRQENSNVHLEKTERGRGKSVSSCFPGRTEASYFTFSSLNCGNLHGLALNI